jgi:hypothetical protein
MQRGFNILRGKTVPSLSAYSHDEIHEAELIRYAPKLFLKGYILKYKRTKLLEAFYRH